MKILAVWTVVIYALSFSDRGVACPDICYCSGTNVCKGTYVNCYMRGLTKIPTNYPNDTCALNLVGNRITEIEHGSFEELAKLQFLGLNYNGITKIENGTFEGLEKLKELYLLDNQISRLEKEAFVGMPNLQTMYLMNNSLRRVDKEFFVGLPNLQTLAIERNPLNCDCVTVDFVNFAKTKNWTLKNSTDPRCKTPRNHADRLLKYLTNEILGCPVTTQRTSNIRRTPESTTDTNKGGYRVCHFGRITACCYPPTDCSSNYCL